MRYISWVVSKPPQNYNDRVLPAQSLGEWSSIEDDTPTESEPSNQTNSEVDDNNNPVLDENGSQLVTLGLKSIYKANTKEQAGGLLAPTDWHVVKAAEVSSYTVPSTVTQYRSDVRTASNTIETAIDNAADLDAFIALFDVPVDSDGNPTGNAPINDWPDEV